jgi:hypothetical protein
MPKSFYEVRELKANWKSDPIWDIEDTEGFEDHKVELKAYRLEMGTSWAKQNEERLQKRAAELECSVRLVEYIEILEYRLERFDDRLDKHDLGYT